MAAIAAPVAKLLNNINLYVVNPLIILVFSVALLIFLFGIFQFIRHADADKERDLGKKKIGWGLIGMFIMFSAYGLIRIILLTFHLKTSTGYQDF